MTEVVSRGCRGRAEGDHQAVPRASWRTTTSTSRSPAGEIHAIVGENGAGKSTLMKILYGMHRPDEGTIEVRRREVHFRSPKDAIAAGVGMVHQHFMLADNLTVLENVVLGSEPSPDRCSTSAKPGTASTSCRATYGMPLHPDRLVEEPLGRRASAGRDHQGPVPGRPHPDPGRADGGPGPAGGRRAVPEPPRAEARGRDGHLHLPQARRGPGDRRRASRSSAAGRTVKTGEPGRRHRAASSPN